MSWEGVSLPQGPQAAREGMVFQRRGEDVADVARVSTQTPCASKVPSPEHLLSGRKSIEKTAPKRHDLRMLKVQGYTAQGSLPNPEVKVEYPEHRAPTSWNTGCESAGEF